MDRVITSTLFIHNSKLEFYKKEAEANAQYIGNKTIVYYDKFTEVLTKLL